MQVILVITFASGALLLWMYLFYPLVLYAIKALIRDKNHVKADPLPDISIILSTYNESRVIENKIKDLLNIDYPREKYELIVVDSSEDETAKIVSERFSENIRLIREDRRNGKPSAVNEGIQHSKHDIIVLTDAPALLEKEAVKKLVSHFTDEGVGVVTGKYKPVGGEQVFWKFKNTIKMLESGVDSTTFVSGDLCAFRKDVIDMIAEDSLCDDVYLALKARKDGYKVKYEPDSVVFEKVTDKHDDFLVQKTRRAVGGVQETLRFKSMILNPFYGFFGLLIMPTRFLFTVLNPIIFTAFLGSAIYWLVKHSPYFLSLLPMYLVSRRLMSNFITETIDDLLLTLIAQWKALFDYLAGHYDVKWKKVEIHCKEN